ncbi:MAG: FlgB family protein [Pseudomonadota bacterium]
MFEELNVIRMASSLARHASARHRVIAENVANADTPGYRARDVQGFSTYVNEPFTPRATRAGHVSTPGPTSVRYRSEIVHDQALDASGNGNSVSIERELLKAVESQGQHARAVAIYSTVRDIMRLGLGRVR